MCAGKKSSDAGLDETSAERGNPRLVEAWATDSIFKTPESVLYDEGSGRLLVANVNRDPWVRDGNGFISVIDLEGRLINYKWAEGLSGPKGMGIRHGMLYVADIDRLVAIDLNSGAVKQEFLVAEGLAAQLNDVAVADDGRIFVSGSGSETIYELRNGNLAPVLSGKSDDGLGRPNGLLWKNGHLLMLGSRSGLLSRINLQYDIVTPLRDSLGQGDGLVNGPANGYFVSSWAGEIFYLSAGYDRIPLLDCRESGINTADIAFLEDHNLLLVPTFFNNRVIAYYYQPSGQRQ
jgi:outer membrane protein assembly factor BamB